MTQIAHQPPRAPRRPNHARGAWFTLGVYWTLMLVALHWPLHWAPGRRRFPWDKVFHFSSYALLAFLLCMAWWASRPTGPSWSARVKRLLIVIAITLCVGVFDELTQPYTGRDCDWRDLIADAAGATTAAILYLTVLASSLPAAKRLSSVADSG